jgi:methionyl-tRNA formyltransferase
MDGGAIIAQKTIDVEATDTPESLSARLLPLEHALYPEVIADIASGRVIIRQGRIERPSIIRHYNDTPIESERDIDMNQHHTPHEPLPHDQENIIRAQDMWNNFTKATIISGGAVIAVLVLLALIFI